MRNTKFSYIYVVIFVLAFTLIEGLRFGRGIDYNVYYYVFQNNSELNVEESTAIFFDLLCYLFIKINLPYQAIVIFCSAILAIAGVKLLVQYPKILFLSLPWFYYLTFSAENLFRWYTAFAFLLIGITYLLNGKIYGYICCCILAIGFHLMIAVPALLFYLISRAKSPLLSPLTSILIYGVLTLLWSSSFMKSFISPVNYILSFWGHYIDVYGGSSLGAWLDGSQHGLAEITIARQVLNFCKNVFLIFLGNKLLIRLNGRAYVFYYNCMLIGIITYPAFAPIELFDRFNQLFLFFQCIVGSYCILLSFKVLSLRKYLLLSIITIMILGQGMYKRLTPSNKYFTYYVFNTPIEGCLPGEWLKKGF